MLVLMRRTGDSIAIGDDITVTVVKVQDGKVKLGFTAPKTVAIVRHDAIKRDREEPIPQRYMQL